MCFKEWYTDMMNAEDTSPQKMQLSPLHPTHSPIQTMQTASTPSLSLLALSSNWILSAWIYQIQEIAGSVTHASMII